MNRLLLLMRHAKSSWKDDSLDDEARPLNKRGRDAAKLMGRYLREHGLVPDSIVASSAVRAQETARRVAKAGDFAARIDTAPDIYLSGSDAYVRSIGRVDASVGTLMVIGHNPDLEILVRRLTGVDETMPTGAVACIDVAADDWAAFANDPRGALRDVLRPRELFGDVGDA